MSSPLGISNIGLRPRVAIAMTVVAFISVFGWQLASTHYSTSCDPGLVRFNYLHSDLATQSKPADALIEWEWDQPDNEFGGCGWTHISYTMVGPDNHTIYEDANQAFTNHGWSQDPIIPGVNFESYERQSRYGKLEAIVSQGLGGRRVPVVSTRAGHIPGTHRVGFDSSGDQILLVHSARSRAGFAAGALLAARWIVGRQGVYAFADVLDDILALERKAP